MHAKVQVFLDSKKETEAEKYEKTKNETLLELGLYEKVYSDFDHYSNSYPYVDWDDINKKDRYYKKVPIAVTDEEYKEIQKYTKKEETVDDNPVANVLTVIAWLIFLVGFLAGIILGTQEVPSGSYYRDTELEFSFAVAFVYWGVAFISGTMFLGFAEIIKLLQAIKKK